MSTLPAAAPNRQNDQAIRTLAGAKTLNDLGRHMIPLFRRGEVRLTISHPSPTPSPIAAPLRVSRRAGGGAGHQAAPRAPATWWWRLRCRSASTREDRYPDVDLKLIDTSVNSPGITRPRSRRCSKAPFSPSSSCCCSAHIRRHHHRRALAPRRSPGVLGDGLLGFSSISSASSPSRCRPEFWSTTPSSRSRTACVTCGWANRLIAPRGGRRTKSARRDRDQPAIIAIFAPASFMSASPVSFQEFGITVSVQVFFRSWRRALSPRVLAAYFLKDHPHDDPPPGRGCEATPTRDLVGEALLVTVRSAFGIFALSSGASRCCRRLPAGAGHRAFTAAMELPPGTQLASPKRHGGNRRALTQRRESRACSSMRPGCRGNVRGARRRADHHYTPKTEAPSPSAQPNSRSARTRKRTDIRYWFLDEKRPARDLAGRHRRDSNIVGNVASELATQMKRIPLIAMYLGNLASTGRGFGSSRARISRQGRRLHRKPLSQTIRVATIGDVGPALANSTPATGRCRSGFSSRTAARQSAIAGAIAGAAGSGAAIRGGVPCRWSPTSSSTRARPSINRYDGNAGHRGGRPRRRLRARRRHQENLRAARDESLPKGVKVPLRRRRQPQRTVGKALPPR